MSDEALAVAGVVLPLRAAELLSEELPSGALEHAQDLRGFLADVAHDAAGAARLTAQAQSLISGLNGDSVRALRMHIHERIRPGMRALEVSALAGSHACRAYVTTAARLELRARDLVEQVDRALREIRLRMREIEEFAVRLHLGGEYPWSQGAPIQIPDLVDLDLLVPDEALSQQRLRLGLADAWGFAAGRWRGALTEISDSQQEWSEVRREWLAAEKRLVQVLAESPLGAWLGLYRSEISPQAVAAAFSGEYLGAQAPTAGMGAEHPLLERLIGNSFGSLEVIESVDPDRVARLWADLTVQEQGRLINEVPRVIGNLPGLSYDVRDQANRLVLERYMLNPGRLGADGRSALRQVADAVTGEHSRSPKVSLVAFDLEQDVPRVILGFGELDRADHLTWQVPGMGSDAHLALTTWVQASRNLYAEQQAVLGNAGAAEEHAVIAFLGYDAPNLLDSFRSDGVFSEEPARLGAVRLAAELDGVVAARTVTDESVAASAQDIAPPRVAVAAHSYGTTVAANALTLVRHPVATATFFGSAGLDLSVIDELSRMRVAEQVGGRPAVFVSTANDDLLAHIGMVYGSRGNPNANVGHPSAPLLTGALYFPVEGFDAAEGRSFGATDGHSVLGESEPPWYRPDRHLVRSLGFEASAEHGYWDRETQSLHNLAASTLGKTDQIVGGISHAVPD